MQSPPTPTFSGFFKRARALTIDGLAGNLNSRARRRSNAGSVSYGVMPPELWLNVFNHIPVYLLSSVMLNVVKTCDSAFPSRLSKTTGTESKSSHERDLM
jgi:hypothetical protein